MRVLIVEDEFSTRKLLQRILETYGDCDVAVNGREAVEAFEEAWKEGAPYNLVCLDIKMPEMNGQEVLQHIRKHEESRGIVAGEERACVLMTTGLEDPKNFMQAVRGGCEGYLTKPISREQLLDTLRAFRLIR